MREIGKFLMNGGLYRGSKPVMWSVVEQTALAEAEVEYHDHTSTQVWVNFPVAKPSVKALEGASVVIWTTTPWTLPGNRAIAFNEDLDYVVIEVAIGARWQRGDGRREARRRGAARGEFRRDRQARRQGRARRGQIRSPARSARHPLHGQGYDFDVPLLAGDFVTDVDGTGFVHIAPGHGEDDFVLGQKHGIQVPQTVGRRRHLSTACAALCRQARLLARTARPAMPTRRCSRRSTRAGALLAQAPLVHSYPHSWRSKAPLIFRTTPQWFIAMETNGSAGEGARRDRRDALVSGAGPEPHRLDDREAARLVHLAPARLGRADRRLRRQEDRRAAARPGGRRPHRRGLRAGRRRCLVRHDPPEFLGNDSRSRRLRAGQRHRRCLVRLRLDACFRAGAAARSEMAGLALSRRLGPASRLVPFLAAGDAAARAAARPTRRC